MFCLFLPNALRDLVSPVPPQRLNFSSVSPSFHKRLPRPHIHHLHTRTPALRAPRFLACLHPLTPPVCLSAFHSDGFLPAHVTCLQFSLLSQNPQSTNLPSCPIHHKIVHVGDSTGRLGDVRLGEGLPWSASRYSGEG